MHTWNISFLKKKNHEEISPLNIQKISNLKLLEESLNSNSDSIKISNRNNGIDLKEFNQIKSNLDDIVIPEENVNFL